MSVNKVILIGRLGQKPEIRNTPAGGAVVNFSVATNESWVDKNNQKQERTEWHRVVVWGKLAQLCHDYLDKGRQVYLEGRLQTRQWQDKDNVTKYTTEVVASAVQFLGDRNASQGQSQGQSYGSSRSTGAAPQNNDDHGFGNAGPVRLEEPSFTEEDIPF